MPKYEITAPDGRTMTIEGQRQPTQEEAQQLFAQYKVQQERSTGEVVGGVFDAAATAVTGALAQPISGIAGIARALTQGADAGAARVQEMQER